MLQMANGNELGTTVFAEAVLRHSEAFEHLGHSRAFEQVLLDKLITRQDLLEIKSVDLPHMLVPAELIEAHNWPADFNIKDLKAEILSYPETENCEKAWLFTASYKVNGQSYFMSANEESVISNFYDNNGGNSAHRFNPGTATRFLKTIAQAVLYESGHPVSDKTPIASPENSDELRTLLKTTGNMKGKYTYALSSFIEDSTKPNRGLIIKHKETESPRKSGLNIDFTMIWRVGDEKSTEVTSHQEEYNVGDDDGDSWSIRYAERKPTDIEPEDLPFGMDYSIVEEDDRSRVMFAPGNSGLNYEIANTSIVTLLYPYLDKHRHLDQDTPLEIEEAYLPDEFAN